MVVFEIFLEMGWIWGVRERFYIMILRFLVRVIW